MRVSWNGKDITDDINVTGCIWRDASGRVDSLELTLDNPEQWFRWGAEEGDEISVAEGNTGTGTMYLNAVIPLKNAYRVLATSLPGRGGEPVWKAYDQMSFRDLAALCAAEYGMTAEVYGAPENGLSPWIMRRDEGAAAFLGRIAKMEGYALKIYGGIFRGIYLPWAQERTPAEGIPAAAGQEGIRYRRRSGAKWAALTVKSPWTEATARDRAVTDRKHANVMILPARNPAQAGRWARALLLNHNREAEELTVEKTLDLKLSAMERIDIAGNTDANGAWIVEEAEHDLKNKTSRAKLRRVIDTIA